MDFLHGPPVCVCVCVRQLCISCFPLLTCLNMHLNNLYNILTVPNLWNVSTITSCWFKKNKKTGYSSRRTYSLCKGRILVSWCRGTQWGQSWLLEGVQTRRRPCNRRQAQSESWTDHTLSLKTWYSEASSVCPHQPCNSLMTGRVFITHRHDWWMHSTQKMSTDKKMNYRKKWCNC